MKIHRAKYTTHIDARTRVFSNFDSFLDFFSRNRNNMERLKVHPPKLGSDGFGSIEVKLKSFNNVPRKAEFEKKY
ncbi:hypothetical protein [Salegentibacter sp. UBA1130]|uniref:hypothetical protein n=1 Tax=Salegentibacter sp. UBA1130 TaxID=1947451 RepID=UPI0025795B67|nr:hypothetical protein [Salegentibacter sp. UBA1130]